VRLESRWEIVIIIELAVSFRIFDGFSHGGDLVDEIILTPEQEVAAQRIEDNLKAQATVEIRKIARILASKQDHELLGETEFQVRDAVHRIGARGFDAALEERKKRGTEDRA
jgi:hypothetical protein